MQTPERNLVLILLVGFVIVVITPIARVSANVTLSKFDAKAASGKIVIEWTTATELNNAGFNILRADSASGPFSTKLNGSKLIPGCFGCIGGQSYSYNDTTALVGKIYYYKLESIDSHGGTPQYSDVKSAVISLSTSTPTKTNTTVPNATATRTSTSAPAATATRTSTIVPTATRTNTLVPGAPTFTPAPTFTASPIPTAAQKIAQVAPSPTTARPGGAIVLPTVTPAPATNPTRIALAPVAPTDPLEEQIAPTQTTRFNFAPLIAIGVILATGATSVTGFALAIFALYLFIRAKRRS